MFEKWLAWLSVVLFAFAVFEDIVGFGHPDRVVAGATYLLLFHVSATLDNKK